METSEISFNDIRKLLQDEHYQEADIAELEGAFEFAKNDLTNFDDTNINFVF